MAELKITANITQAQSQLKKLDTELTALKNKASDLKIDIKGVDTLQKLTSALQQYSKSQVDATNALSRAKQAEIDLLNARTKLVNATTLANRKKQEEINIDKKATLEKEKQATAEKQLAVETEKRAAKTATATARIVSEQEKTRRALIQTESAAKKLGDTWSRMFSQFTLSSIISTTATRAIYMMRQYFREALNEMKELDTALTHYRQVTGASASEAAQIGEEAYSVGSRYGTKASDYAESVATYARAGYGEVADELAELSLKTVIVGQTTQEIADQFLLTMDAAYGYKGSVEELSRVLDGASAIDSNYATTIEKIAAGLGLVAPLAKQVHVSEEQLTAAIGTITATTQRSGAESARALRSLFLNILKDTKTEIEEGVTATEESVADMETLLNRYAKSAVEAAEASGQVINPMEAIGALAQSMKEGFLTEKELMDMMSSLGGKLRVSQLVALVSNWDMYNDMIQTYENSMGSADQKTTTYLDSWEAKTNILKNTWTQFIASSLNTNTIKGFLTGITNILKVIGNLGNAIKMVATAVALVKITKRISELNTFRNTLTQSSAALRRQATAFQQEAIGAEMAGDAEARKAAEDAAATASAQADTAATEAQTAAHLALAMTIGTVVVSALLVAASAYANYHRQRMQQLEEERDKAIETARVQQDKADEVYSAYETLWNAKNYYDDNKISAEQYEEAVYNLATALGVQETAIKNNIDALKTLSQTEILKAINETENALQVAKLQAREELNSFNLTKKHKSNWEVPKGMESDTNKYIPMIAELSSTKDEERAVQIYKDLIKLQDFYLNMSKGNGKRAELYGDAWADLTAELEGYSAILDPIIAQEELLTKYQQQRENIKTGNIEVQELKDVASSLHTSENYALAAAGAFDGLASAIKKAKGELEAYQKQTQTEKDDDYTAYADAWKKGYEDYTKGLKNTNAMNALIDLWLTPEQVMAFHDKGIEAADVIMSDFWKEIFTYTDDKGETQFINDDAGSNFIWALKEKYADAAGEIRNQNGDLVASFQEVDGELSVQVDDFGKLSKALSEMPENPLYVDPNYLAIIFEALTGYTTEMQYTAENLKELAASLNAVTLEGNIDLDKLIQGELDAGKPTEEIADLYDNVIALNEAGEIKIDVKEGEKLEDVQARVKELIQNRDEINDKEAEAKVTADTEDAMQDMERVILKERQIERESPTISVDLDDYKAKIQADKLKTELEQKKITWTVNVKVNQVGSANLRPALADTEATGTKNARGGLTLVNEEGAELIQEGDNARIAGNGKPTLTWVQSGATVYNATETKAILGGSDYSNLYDGINAYAGGTATGIPRYEPKGTSTKEESGGGNNNGNGNGNNNNNKSDTKNDKDEELERLKDIVALRESELNLLEAQDASYKKLIKKYEEINKAIQDEIEHLQKTKGNEKEINDLKVKQLKNEKEIKKLEEEQVEKQKDRLKNIVELRKSELQLIQAKGGSIKEQIKKERQIYQAIEKQVVYAKKHGATKKEINELLEEQYKVQKNINDLNKELYDTLKGSINKEVDKLNEKRDKELEKIDKRIEKIQKSNDEEKKATELQEKQLAVEEARDKLSKARQERTIRYYNAAKGQWERRADQQQVDTAKKELEDAKKALKDYKDQQKLDKRVADLEKKKEEVTQKYLEKTDQWQKVLDSLEEPVKSVAQSLKAIEKNATKNQKSTIQALNKLLKPLGYNIDVSKLYDSGGILTGTGGIKGTSKDEVILPPDIASKMLKPISTATLNSRLNELRYLYGATNMNPSGVMNSSIGSQYNGNLYTFGNITLTEGQARSTTIYDLVQRSRGLRAYSGGM